MRSFAIDVLGLEMKFERSDFVVADAANGDRFEIFGPGAGHPSWQFDHSPVMIGFRVDDIEAARDALAATTGVQLLGELEGDDRYKWQHFRAPNGVAFELTWDARVETT